MKINSLKSFKRIWIPFSIVVAGIEFYLIGAILLSFIPCNNNFKPATHGVDIYILSNGVHTDLVLHAKNKHLDWTQKIDLKNTVSKDSSIRFIAFGWGDKAFYLQTPTWNQLKLSTAFNAAFALSSTAMHVTCYHSITSGEYCKKIRVNDETYIKLVSFISDSFKKDVGGNFICIRNAHYSDDDLFYEATGKYSFFKTCNTWTNDALKASGMKACFWTATDKGILRLY